jgi:hypothetical protein
MEVGGAREECEKFNDSRVDIVVAVLLAVLQSQKVIQSVKLLSVIGTKRMSTRLGILEA